MRNMQRTRWHVHANTCAPVGANARCVCWGNFSKQTGISSISEADSEHSFLLPLSVFKGKIKSKKKGVGDTTSLRGKEDRQSDRDRHKETLRETERKEGQRREGRTIVRGNSVFLFSSLCLCLTMLESAVVRAHL